MFESIAQIGVCVGAHAPNWDCNKWLKETPSVCCLPHRKGGHRHHRCMKNGQRITGPIQTGPRGGKYFTITEKDNKGEICTVKIYISKK